MTVIAYDNPNFLSNSHSIAWKFGAVRRYYGRAERFDCPGLGLIRLGTLFTIIAAISGASQ